MDRGQHRDKLFKWNKWCSHSNDFT